MAATALALTTVALLALLALTSVELIHQRKRANQLDTDHKEALAALVDAEHRAQINGSNHLDAVIAHVQSDLDHKKAIELLHDELLRVEGGRSA